MSTNYAQRWGEFVSATSFAELPGDVTHRMKRSLLDMLGCAVIGSRSESSDALGHYLTQAGGTPEATLLPSGRRTSSFQAALANGTHVHAPELAESFTRATMHCGNAVPPAALAEVEKQHGSGQALLVAMAVGYEIAIRTGLSVRAEPPGPTFAAKDENRPSGPLGPRYISHPVSTFGLYGAAAAAASALGLDPARAAQAMVLSTSLTPTIGRGTAYWEGAMAKDIFQGLSNAIGVMSAELAAVGVTGGDDVTAHLGSLVSDYEPTWLDHRLGEEWLISSGGLHFKLHMTSGMTQPAADAILDALRKRPFDPHEVDKIDAWVPERGLRQSAVQQPPTMVASTISIPYVLSTIIAFYDDVRADPYFTELYRADRFDDPRRRALADKIFVHGSDRFSHGFEQEWPMTFESRVEVRLTSGEIVTGEAEIWSVSANLSDSAVEDKFRDVAGRVLSKDRIERAIHEVFRIDEAENLDSLLAAVCGNRQA